MAHPQDSTRVAKLDHVLTAARALLERIDNITTEEFQRGGEREEREALREAIARLAA